MDVYDEIRERVSCLDAARQYGLQIQRNGFCLCPFHADTKPSLKLYDGDRGFYCFSCGTGGDVIKLTGQLLGMDRVDAARRLNTDFRLGLPFDRPRTRADRQEARKRRKIAETYSVFQTWKEETERLITSVYRLGWRALRDLPETLWFEAEIEAIKLLPALENWLDLLGGGMDQQIQVYRDRRGVRETCKEILKNMPERFRQD